MAEEAGNKIADIVSAELVECVPAPDAPAVPLPDAPAATPQAQAREATIEQTGAEPPPRARQHSPIPALTGTA